MRVKRNSSTCFLETHAGVILSEAKDPPGRIAKARDTASARILPSGSFASLRMTPARFSSSDLHFSHCSFLSDEAGQDGERERDVGCRDDEREGRREGAAPGVELRVVESERLEHAPEAVVQVQ